MVRFGDTVIDVDARLVRRGGSECHLQPQAFDVLAHLVEHRDRVVSKEELLDEIWGDQFVSESALTTRIKEIRQAVGDDGTRQAVIKNVRGRGYRFVAELDGVATSPPPQSLALFGRDEDIAAVRRQLAESRLVTIVGPGGVGKTSLAAEVARIERGRRSGGIITIRLAAVRDASMVVHAIRRTTDLTTPEHGDDALIRSFADLDALVVLDNCEHVIEEVARLARRVLEVDGRARFLATSRERLGVPGEQVWPLDVLSWHAAIELLGARTHDAHPDFELDTSSPSVTELVDLLDRLPLAIEMAAARLPTIGVAELVELVRDRVDVLRSPDRGVDDRHRSLSALIAWSEGLLDDDQRELLAAFSVFSGSVTAGDVAAVVGDHSSTHHTSTLVADLADLVDRSLLVANPFVQPTRYRMLETVRSHVAPRRPADVDRRHAEHFVAVATEADRQIRHDDESNAHLRIEAIVPELRSAHAWLRRHDRRLATEMSVALMTYAHQRHWVEPPIWAERLRDALAADDPLAAAADVARAGHAGLVGDHDLAVALAQPAIDHADVRVRVAAHDVLTDDGLYRGDLDGALSHAAELVALGREHADSYAIVMGNAGRAMALAYGGRTDAAAEVVEEMRSLTGLGPTDRAWIEFAGGEVLVASGRHAEAIERYERAIDLAGAVGSSFAIGVSQVALLAAHTHLGDLDAARADFVPVLRQYRRNRNVTQGVTALRNLVQLLVHAGDDEVATQLLGALSGEGVKATYGSEQAAIDRVAAIVAGRNRAEDVERWHALGVAHDPLWAIDRALEHLVSSP